MSGTEARFTRYLREDRYTSNHMPSVDRDQLISTDTATPTGKRVWTKQRLLSSSRELCRRRSNGMEVLAA